ncbi:hypothetical protein Dimus_013460, partial [Dionaea muscipula]
MALSEFGIDRIDEESPEIGGETKSDETNRHRAPSRGPPHQWRLMMMLDTSARGILVVLRNRLRFFLKRLDDVEKWKRPELEPTPATIV